MYNILCITLLQVLLRFKHFKIIKYELGVELASPANDKELKAVAGVVGVFSIEANGVADVEGKQKTSSEAADARVFLGSGAGVVGVGGAK